MFSTEQIARFMSDKQCQKAGNRYNWLLYKSVLPSSDFQISIDISISSLSLKDLFIIPKILYLLARVIFISRKIRKFRDDVLVRILNKDISNSFNVGSLIAANYKWCSADSEKLYNLRTYFLMFISDIYILEKLYEIAGIAVNQRVKREQFINNLMVHIDVIFNNVIAGKLCDQKNLAVVEYERFINRFNENRIIS